MINSKIEELLKSGTQMFLSFSEFLDRYNDFLTTIKDNPELLDNKIVQDMVQFNSDEVNSIKNAGVFIADMIQKCQKINGEMR
ncbi:MAG: hypothetical protein K5657_10235 [Desulfovibrio sp.]|nr:hypothetical protein [Desulfovibrio sp.]